MMRGQGRVFQRKYRDKRTGKVKVSMTFTLEYYLDGTMCREASGTTSYTEAVRQLKRRQGEIAQGRRVTPAADRLTFEHLAANLVGDSLNALLRHDPKTLIGLPIGALMIWYLVKKKNSAEK